MRVGINYKLGELLIIIHVTTSKITKIFVDQKKN